jgi:hypothetical protein
MIYNMQYFKQVSRVMREIINSIDVKKYYNLTYDGNVCCKLLIELSKLINGN